MKAFRVDKFSDLRTSATVSLIVIYTIKVALTQRALIFFGIDLEIIDVREMVFMYVYKHIRLVASHGLVDRDNCPGHNRSVDRRRD